MRTINALFISVFSAGMATGGTYDREATYSGRLTPVMVSDANAVAKGFDVTWLLPLNGQDAAALFVVAEDAFALPWPARFGFCPLTGGQDGPTIGYRFGDRDHTVPLPGVRFEYADKVAATNELTEGRLAVKVSDEHRDVAGHVCRMVKVADGPTRQETIAVERETGIIVRFESDVFLGRGDRFRLTLELKQMKNLGDAAVSRERLAPLLRSIFDATETEDRESGHDLPAATLAKIEEFQKPLAEIAKGTAFETLSDAITRSVSEQRTRRKGVGELADKFVGKAAPSLDLKQLDGQSIDPATLKNKVVVLHFWDYDHEQLVTPYGQVGYLDHLSRQRAKLGVEVIGIAVDSRFGDPQQSAAAVRSANKLISFMNLSYPIASDDGTLLRAFGDPRSIGARLPLWIVIDKAGLVRAYKSGLYDLNVNDGLKELDAKVVELVKSTSSEGKR